MTHEDKLRRIAAGAPYPLQEGMLEEAIASEQSVEAFALAVADWAVVERAARAVLEA